MLQTDYNANFINMREIGQDAAYCLDSLAVLIRPGIKTQNIDDWVSAYADSLGLICAPKDYKGFPAYCCTSVNHQVCHGIPSPDKILKDGDIIKVDVTFKDKDGWHGDSCRTFAVGTPSVKAQRLINVTRNALDLGIAQCYPGKTIGDIGQAIQTFVEGEGFSVVKGYVGHEIGQVFHGDMHIYHHYDKKIPGMSTVLEPGMMFTIEPMVNAGKPETKVLKDGWTVVTRDRSLSAQFEHTIGITSNGHVVFTE